jgi:Ca2+-binding EF-hand superfamily protein
LQLLEGTYIHIHIHNNNIIIMSEEAMKGLTEEQVADLKEAFAMFDINGDGMFCWIALFVLFRSFHCDETCLFVRYLLRVTQ